MAKRDVIGYYETIVEYYTGRDASQMSEEALILKVGHIHRIRQAELESELAKSLSLFQK